MFALDRKFFIVIAISLLSALAGIGLYRVTLMQPEFISANNRPDTGITTAAQKIPAIKFEDIVLNDLHTRPQHLSDWKAPILVVNFWAPWCPPCRREIPALIELQKTYPEKMQLIGLAFDSPKNVVDFSAKNPMNYPSLLVQTEATQINHFFGNSSSGLPFTAILNARREIVFQHHGEISKEQLETQIKALL